jgi:hypothetical protein
LEPTTFEQKLRMKSAEDARRIENRKKEDDGQLPLKLEN